jgi:hypothetical protein
LLIVVGIDLCVVAWVLEKQYLLFRNCNDFFSISGRMKTILFYQDWEVEKAKQFGQTLLAIARQTAPFSSSLKK